jgi:ATP-dependent helicase/nuclease subunit A
MSFTVYKSSAGSGKTFTLVKEYLKLILPEPSAFRHILAITFTNKAANEMKERVLSMLRELSRPSSDRDAKVTRDMLPWLMKETGLTEQEIILNAGNGLRMILHHYSDFAIGTIDSFSHRVIRSFAYDFGLPVNFNVELDSDELLETAVDLLLDRVGDDPDLTTLLVRFLETRMEEEQGFNIDRILFDFSKILLDEEGISHLSKIENLSLADFDTLVRHIYSQVKNFETAIQSIGKEAIDLIDHHSIPLGAFSQGDKGIGGYFDKMARGKWESMNSDNYSRKTITDDKWVSGKVDALSQKAIELIKPQLTEFFTRIVEIREKNQKFYKFLVLLTKTIYPLAVLKEIDRALKDFKKQNSIVHISEFNRKIASLVVNEPVPFIYERLGERYNHVLIDEFQDTSRLQWCNLQPLIENSLASGYFNLVVGDGKQAIYRWRNGDVQQFSRLPQLPGSQDSPVIADRERILRDNYESFPLNRNYRSKAEIVAFNNRLFTSIAQTYPEELDGVYDQVMQEYDPAKTGGLISIEFLQPEEEGDSYRELTLNRVYAIIQSLEAENYRPGDIAVLCRKNRDGSEIARFLIGKGISVVSSESLLISRSAEVKFVIGILRLINEPDNALYASELITYLHQHNRLGGAHLHPWLARITSGWAAKTCQKILTENGYNISFRKYSVKPVFELCEELIDRFSLNDTPDPYLQFFLDTVLKFSGKYSTSQSAFLEWWDLHSEKLSVIIPEGINAVRILSIHKAKGLQFPVVIYPFADEKKRTGKNFLWVDIPDGKLNGLKAGMLKPNKEMLDTDYKSVYEEEDHQSLLDMVNTFYVAMTRPEDRLYLLTQPISTKSKSKTPSIPLFLENYLHQSGDWIEGKTVYEIGSATSRMTHLSGKISPKSILLQKFIYNSWQEKIYIRAKAPVMWNADDPQQRSEWGKMVHYLLSEIDSENDLDAVITSVESAGMMDGDDTKRLVETLHQIIRHPEVKAYFSPDAQVRKEAEILLADGKVLRPDRVILDQNHAIVIDYKTGKESESHAVQLNLYEKVLIEMGYDSVKKILLYTEPIVKVVEV